MNNIYCIHLMFNKWYWTTVSGFVNYKRMDNLLGKQYLLLKFQSCDEQEVQFFFISSYVQTQASAAT